MLGWGLIGEHVPPEEIPSRIPAPLKSRPRVDPRASRLGNARSISIHGHGAIGLLRDQAAHLGIRSRAGTRTLRGPEAGRQFGTQGQLRRLLAHRQCGNGDRHSRSTAEPYPAPINRHRSPGEIARSGINNHMCSSHHPRWQRVCRFVRQLVDIAAICDLARRISARVESIL